jgi:CMP-N-acetylneuraminic acid synthetase
MKLLNPRIVALLPMKANSERVKGKNFKDFNGKPLFRWILDTLLSLEEVSQIVINTDARDILAEKGLIDSDKILIRDRKSDLCGDFVSMNKILADDISKVDADCYLMTHTTNPLLSHNSIQGAIAQFTKAYEKNQADSLFTVNKVQSRFYRKDGSPVNHDPDNLIRTQDLEPWYEENSNLYIFTKEAFLKKQARIGEKPLLFESSNYESIDIDGPEEWELAIIAAKYQDELKKAEKFL